jgi:hypothetical protein
MHSSGLYISNQLAAEIFRHLAFICADESAKKVLLELRHNIRRFAAKQTVVDVSGHVNVLRVFAACWGASTGTGKGTCKGSSTARKDNKHFKHGRDVPPEAQLQYLKSGIFAQALVHNKFFFTFPKNVRGDAWTLSITSHLHRA